jgi:acyl-CoA thioesterase-1
MTPEPLSAFLAGMRALAVTAFETPVSYPSKLRSAFSLRYPGQAITVVNEGVPGEQTTTAVDRLPSVLDASRPEVLLLQHGANDIYGNNRANLLVVRDNVRRMIRLARARQVAVLAGTLLPQRQGACRGASWALVPEVNDLLRPVIAAEGAVLVDLYEAFGGQAGSLIGPDGLHPNEAGYQKMADTFFDTIRQRFE